jgi:hypothetical protein
MNKKKKKTLEKNKNKVSLTILVLKSVTSVSGVFTFLWLVQYNCYRQLVEMYRCNSGKEMKAMSEYSGCVTYHSEGNQGDCTVTNAVFTTHALTMNEDDNHARSVRASSRITFVKEVFLTN